MAKTKSNKTKCRICGRRLGDVHARNHEITKRNQDAQTADTLRKFLRGTR